MSRRLAFTSDNALTKAQTIEYANEHVSIAWTLRQSGVYVPDEYVPGISVRASCPFEFLHVDQGLSKALKVYYDTNTAMCFAESLYLTPVRLWRLSNDLPSDFAAATSLLRASDTKIGYATDAERQKNIYPFLEEALSIYCRSLWGDEWSTIPLSNPQAHGVYVQCLGLARSVTTDEASVNWLDKSKQIMSRVFTRMV